MCGSRAESNGGRIQNIGRVLPASTLIGPSSMPSTTSSIMRFSNPNLKPSILSAIKIEEEKEEEELFPFSWVTSFEVY